MSKSKGRICFVQGLSLNSQNIGGGGCRSHQTPRQGVGMLEMLDSLEEALDPTL